MTIQQLEQNIIQWAAERGIYEHSTIEAQALKAVSEMGELADAVIKSDSDGVQDAVGDVIVCLVNVAHLHGFTLTQCLTAAWLEIKDRRGKMVPGGAFVKD